MTVEWSVCISCQNLATCWHHNAKYNQSGPAPSRAPLLPVPCPSSLAWWGGILYIRKSHGLLTGRLKRRTYDDHQCTLQYYRRRRYYVRRSFVRSSCRCQFPLTRVIWRDAICLYLVEEFYWNLAQLFIMRVVIVERSRSYVTCTPVWVL